MAPRRKSPEKQAHDRRVKAAREAKKALSVYLYREVDVWDQLMGRPYHAEFASIKGRQRTVQAARDWLNLLAKELEVEERKQLKAKGLEHI